MNKIYGLGLIALGFAIGMFIGKNQTLVRRTGRNIVALKDDARELAQSAGEWIERGKSELTAGRDTLTSAASSAAAAYQKLTT